jgi:hypothetical protein
MVLVGMVAVEPGEVWQGSGLVLACIVCQLDWKKVSSNRSYPYTRMVYSRKRCPSPSQHGSP